MSAGSRLRRLALLIPLALELHASPSVAQEAPVGPCSPFRAHDGDVPSEMPGCGRRARPAAGSLADEVEFARERRGGVEAGPDDPDEDAAPPRRHRRR